MALGHSRRSDTWTLKVLYLADPQLRWYVFVIWTIIELILMSTLSYRFIAFIQQIFCRQNDVTFLIKLLIIFLIKEKETWKSKFWRYSGKFWWRRLMRASGFIYSHGNITQVISSLFPSAKSLSYTYGFLLIQNTMLRVV